MEKAEEAKQHPGTNTKTNPGDSEIRRQLQEGVLCQLYQTKTPPAPRKTPETNSNLHPAET